MRYQFARRIHVNPQMENGNGFMDLLMGVHGFKPLQTAVLMLMKNSTKFHLKTNNLDFTPRFLFSDRPCFQFIQRAETRGNHLGLRREAKRHAAFARMKITK